MISKATAHHIRISPRKVRYVIDRIRNKGVEEALIILSGSPRRAEVIISKLLNQAVDAAQKNSQIPAEDLFVSKVLADGGPTMRRFRAASMGRGMTIRKRTSHILLELDIKKQKSRQQPPVKAALQEPKPKKSKVAASGKKLVGAK